MASSEAWRRLEPVRFAALIAASLRAGRKHDGHLPDFARGGHCGMDRPASAQRAKTP